MMDLSSLPNAALDQALDQMRQHLRARRDSTRRRALADHVSADQIDAFMDWLDAENDRVIAIAEKALRPLCSGSVIGLGDDLVIGKP